jgi:hypothetical protein
MLGCRLQSITKKCATAINWCLVPENSTLQLLRIDAELLKKWRHGTWPRTEAGLVGEKGMMLIFD